MKRQKDFSYSLITEILLDQCSEEWYTHLNDKKIKILHKINVIWRGNTVIAIYNDNNQFLSVELVKLMYFYSASLNFKLIKSLIMYLYVEIWLILCLIEHEEVMHTHLRLLVSKKTE